MTLQKIFFSQLFFAISLATTGLVDATTHDIPDADDQGRTAGLIRKLGSASLSERTSARKALFAIGGPALKQLEWSSQHRRDEQIRRGAADLILEIQAAQIDSLGTTLVRVEPGEFMMGSSEKLKQRESDEFQHKVKITKPFLIAMREVTQDEFAEVMKRQPSWFSPEGKGYKSMHARFKTGTFPVDSVSWFDAIEYCNRLSKLEGVEPFYALSDVKRREKSIFEAKVKILGGTGFRLPTEAEWEFACRAGTTTPFHFEKVARGGNFQHSAPAGVYGQGWHNAKRTMAVAKYKCNTLGIFDMHGNVAEWCWDVYDKNYYRESPVKDPAGPKNGEHRTLRGGNYQLRQAGCRSASRDSELAGERKPHIGFRIARSVD